MAQVLVADDDPGLREFVVETLELAGHTVTGASDGEMACEFLKKQHFEVFVTDLKMPGKTGIEILREFHDQQPELQIIVMTAYGSIETAVEAMKLGALDFLQKPISGPEELRLLVERAAERHRLLTIKARQSLQTQGDVQLTWGAPKMVAVQEMIRKVARTRAQVLLLGESGSGKEVAARALHLWSKRKDEAFIELNCAALPESLIESELFGHEKGAFTGARERRRGRLELANRGTLFLDEVGELKLDVQAKLLRVLETQRFERVGGSQTVEVDVRFIAATNRDLAAMVERGEFRNDLYHRLMVVPVQLPPLRERPEDLWPLAVTLLREIGENMGLANLELSESTLPVLMEADWPGNIRELKNTLERAAILANTSIITANDLYLLPKAKDASTAPLTMDEIEREAIKAALDRVNGHRRKAAEQLKIGLRTLYDKIKKYNL